MAIANPKVAPYGVAAQATLEAWGLTDQLRDKIVMGENIAQTFQLIDSGAAQLGFVALSQVLGSESGRKGSYWRVLDSLHEPIRQNAILLTRAKNNPEARAFLAFLKSPKTKKKIEAAGYATTEY
jgi:molybdate transport system substrate-binding protein